ANGLIGTALLFRSPMFSLIKEQTVGFHRGFGGRFFTVATNGRQTKTPRRRARNEVRQVSRWGRPLPNRLQREVKKLELSILVQCQRALARTRIFQECLFETSTPAARLGTLARQGGHRSHPAEARRPRGKESCGSGREGKVFRGMCSGLYR